MFQNFDQRLSGRNSPDQVALLRRRMSDEGLTGYIVPHADEHQSEYLPASAERLAWLTGFTGSAGTAIILDSDAALLVDGRYTLQASRETDTSIFPIVDLAETSPTTWLSARLTEGQRIGFDPMLLTVSEVRRFKTACVERGADMVPVRDNLIDEIWRDRPVSGMAPLAMHAIEYAGEPAADKIARLAGQIERKNADAALLTLADSVAWTFNIRGADIRHNPSPLSFAIVPAKGTPTLFVDGRKLTNSIRAHLAGVADLAEPEALPANLESLGHAKQRILVDPDGTPARFAEIVVAAGGSLVEGRDPTLLFKARKNRTEIAGARRAHLRDGISMARFLAWLDAALAEGDLDEIAAVERLEQFRADTAAADGEPLADVSFDTIAGAGPNGAVVHYRVDRSTNRKLEPGSLFLIDSGGQYRDGTTDITRTVAIGTPTEEMRQRYTLVLKGHITLAEARFPSGTTGAQLDGLARTALWRAGLDYSHGTGHGVGSYLSVHEGPARISKSGHVALEPGMILSNEPGYYRPGAYGIRLENLMLVVDPAAIEGGDLRMLSFETLTLCPIDRRLIDAELLTEGERDWVNAYHARVRDALARRLSGYDRVWLEQATRLI